MSRATGTDGPGEAARAYRELGWSVVPVHTPENGACSCGDPDCPSPGKHPRVRWQPYIERAPDRETVERWWRRWPRANVGVVTGPVSGVVVLDVDPRSGGDRALARLEEHWGPLPPTPETRTGGGGRHLWLARPSAALASVVLAPGLEVKAEAGAVVAPPSLHASGRHYRWAADRSPWDLAPAPAPDWLVALAAGTEGGPQRRHPLRDPPPRTETERRAFAEAWGEAGIDLLSGDRYYLCPFHDDHHPSLHIDADGCRWFCFGCRRGGGIGALRRARDGRPPARPGRRRAEVPEEDRSVTLAGDAEVDVVGESHHQDELLALTGGVRRFGGVNAGTVAELAPEPENRFDADAVAVRIAGLPVGYLRHDDAVRLRPLVDRSIARHGRATCRATIRGGWDRGHGDVGAFGVVLLLPRTAR